MSGGESVSVFHLAGLGKSPGAVTTPLSCVYYLLMAARNGSEAAQKFFEGSGGDNKMERGKPEALIMFTSKEIMTAQVGVDKYEDNWFRSPQQERDTGKVIISYLERLEESTSIRSLKYVCMVKVKVDDFSDIVETVGTTIYALRNKEIWINMVGGKNTINVALLITGLLSGTSTRYYYVNSPYPQLLHPPWIQSLRMMYPKNNMNQKNVETDIETTIKNWIELPFFFMEFGRLVELYNIMKERGGKINSREVRDLLGPIPIEKLRGRILLIDGDSAEPGPFLERVMETYNKIRSANANDFSEWKRWAENKGIIRILRWEK